MKYGSPILNFGLLLLIAILVAFFGYYKYQQGYFLKSGEQTFRGEATETSSQLTNESCASCSAYSLYGYARYGFTTESGIRFQLEYPAESFGAGPNDPTNLRVEKFLKTALIGFKHSILNQKIEVHGDFDTDSKILFVSKDGDYIKAV